MAYTVAWDITFPPGNYPANQIDVAFHDWAIANQERNQDVLGIVSYTADPLVPTTLKFNRTAHPKILGGSTDTSIRNNADSADNLLITDAGIITTRSTFNSGGNILFPTDNTYDIGASAATRPRDLFLGRNATIGGTLGVTGVSTLAALSATTGSFSSTLAVTGTSTFTGAVQVNNNITITGVLTAGSASYAGTSFAGNVIFSPDNTYDIGAAGATRARDFYLARNAVIGGTLGVTGLITGSLATAAQGNITSLGTLTSLTVSGVSTLTGNLIFTADNTYDVGASGATRARTLYLGTSVIAPTGTFTNIGGTLTTAAQPNITSLGTLTSLTVAGAFSAGSSSFTSATITNAITFVPGNAGTASTVYIGGNGSGRLLLNVPTGNEIDFLINGTGIAGLNSTNVFFNTDNTIDVGASGANRPRTGYFGTSIIVPTVTATSLGGTLTTAAQGNITSVGTLTSLSVTGSITAGGNLVSTTGSASISDSGVYQWGAGTTFIQGNSSTNIINFGSNNVSRWRIDSSGYLIAVTDNTYDIGASGATRPRNLYIGNRGTFGAIVTSDGSTGDAGFVSKVSGTEVAFLGATRTWLGSGSSMDAAIAAYGGSQGINFFTAGNGSIRWQISSAGHLIAGTDNTYDIGASGATRPRNLYVAGTGTFGGDIRTTAGLIVAPNNTYFAGRNVANNGDIGIAYVDTSNNTVFGNNPAWYIGPVAKHWLAFTDNVADIGASGASRPRNLYVAGNGTFGSDINISAVTGRINLVSTTTTNAVFADFSNSPGHAYVGTDSSTGNSIVTTNGIAYALALVSASTKPILFAPGGTATWQINSSGHILAITDNTYDIGASGATRPRNLYVGTSVSAPHYIGSGSAPGATTIFSSVTVIGTDAAGLVTVQSAGGFTAGGIICSITYNSAFPTHSYPVVCGVAVPGDTTPTYAVRNVTASGFDVVICYSHGSGVTSTGFTYHVVGD